jgi:Na+-transporting methylmalonyl-CoA/oxaloacetate decarboxylase beta subunit
MAEEIEECISQNLKNKVDSYKYSEKKGVKVYGGVEGVLSGYVELYQEMCKERIELKYTKYSYFALIVIILFYVAPTGFLMKRVLNFVSEKEIYNTSGRSVDKVVYILLSLIIFLIISFIGYRLVWQFCINHNWL